MPIEMKNVSFSFDELDQPLFQEVNMTLDTTWRLGLVGRNGRGKTTLLQLLMKNYPYTGEIFSTVNFVYFPLQIAHKELLVYDAINEIMPVELWKLERECTLLQLNQAILWQPFEQLSGGEQTKVLLAALFSDEEHFALLDEPTNHLDMKARDIVARYLMKKKGYIVVSHDRQFLDAVVNHVLVIEKRKLAIFKGDFTTYLRQKERQDQYELTQNKTIKAEIERLQSTTKEKANWASKREKPSGNDPFGNAIAKRMNKRAKAIEQRTATKIEEKSSLLRNIETINALTIQPITSHRNPVLRVKDFTLRYDEKPLFQPITFEVYQGEQVAIVGPNGRGKTAVLQYLITQHFTGQVEGEVIIPKGLSISEIRQKYASNRGSLKEFAKEWAIDYSMLLNNLRILGMERDIFNVPIEHMSEGQKKKVEFAKSLAFPAELYVWDEPLNYLDVFNHQQIETMIVQYKPTLLFVEHAEAFLTNSASKIVELLPYAK